MAGVDTAGRALVLRQADALRSLADQLGPSFQAVVARVAGVRGKVVTTGAGTSGNVAARLAHLLSMCGTPAFHLPVLDALHGGVGAVTPEDVVIAFSTGGRSEDITALVTLLGARGVHVVAVTEAPQSPFARAAGTVVTLRTEPADADLSRLETVRRLARHLPVGVDGGVRLEDTAACLAAGAVHLVSGRALLQPADPAGIPVPVPLEGAR